MNYSSFQTQVKDNYDTFIRNLSDKKLSILISTNPFEFSKLLSNEEIKKYFFNLDIRYKKQYLYKIFTDSESLYTIAKMQTDKELNDFVNTTLTPRLVEQLAKVVIVNSNMLLIQKFLSVIPILDMKEIIVKNKTKVQNILLKLSTQQLLPFFKENFEENFDFTGIL